MSTPSERQRAWRAECDSFQSRIAGMAPLEIVLEFITIGDLEIDNDGAVWRLRDRRIRTMPTAVRRRAEIPQSNGYAHVVCSAMGLSKAAQVSAHRLVWRYFHGPIPAELQINHRNGRKDDNRLANLELVTPRENTQHAEATGLRNSRRESNPAAKLTSADVALIREMYHSGGWSLRRLARHFGVRSKGTIGHILARRTWA